MNKLVFKVEVSIASHNSVLAGIEVGNAINRAIREYPYIKASTVVPMTDKQSDDWGCNPYD